MKKIITQEIYPSDLLGKEMVMTQMTHHYRRVASAKPRVDTNLIRHHSPRPLSAEASKTINRHYRGDASPPKHRACLKYSHENNVPLFKPTIYSTGAESKLKERYEVYHPPVKQPSRGRKTKEEATENGIQTEGIIEENKQLPRLPEKVEKSVQTLRVFNFRPLHKKSVKFLKDITDEALARGAQTNIALERIFRNHQERNKYRLPRELIDRELDMLRRELRMPLASRKSSDSYVSDEDALRALDRLALKPETKREVIATLRLVEKEKTVTTEEGEKERPKQSHIKEPVIEFLEQKESPKTAAHVYLDRITESAREENKKTADQDEEEENESVKDPDLLLEDEENHNTDEEEIEISERESSKSLTKSSIQDQANEQEPIKQNSSTNPDFTSSSQYLSVRNMSQLEAHQELEEVTEDTKESSSATFEGDAEDDENKEEDEEVKTYDNGEERATDSDVESLPGSGSSVSSVHTE